MLPVLETVDSVEELLAAVEDPEAFLSRLASSATPMARKLVVARARPALTPCC